MINEKTEEAMYFASIASGNLVERRAYLKGFEDEGVRSEIANEIREIRSILESIVRPSVSVFAAGNIRGVATGQSNEPLSNGTGTIGITYSSARNVFSGQIAVAATQDTIAGDFGSGILAPANGNALRSAILEYYTLFGRLGSKYWLHLYGATASSAWRLTDRAGASSNRLASTFGFGALVRRQLFSGSLAETKVGIEAEVGFAGRWLDGDVRNMLNDTVEKAQYLTSFPTERNFFPGLELGMTIGFGSIAGSVQAFYLLPKENEPVNGLTGLQLAIGLSVKGDIIRGFLEKKKANENEDI
ncbi:MAG: hypothetical protein EOP49_36640 [Sphingobacteriales bacterium]|nr:MAG: hypothetical protein EOP49_36640 [Sphingobacteriales bacterium]